MFNSQQMYLNIYHIKLHDVKGKVIADLSGVSSVIKWAEVCGQRSGCFMISRWPIITYPHMQMAKINRTTYKLLTSQITVDILLMQYDPQLSDRVQKVGVKFDDIPSFPTPFLLLPQGEYLSWTSSTSDLILS